MCGRILCDRKRWRLNDIMYRSVPKGMSLFSLKTLADALNSAYWSAGYTQWHTESERHWFSSHEGHSSKFSETEFLFSRFTAFKERWFFPAFAGTCLWELPLRSLGKLCGTSSFQRPYQLVRPSCVSEFKGFLQGECLAGLPRHLVSRSFPGLLQQSA